MKYFICVVIVTVLVVATSADPRCSTTPPQWFGLFREIGFDAEKPNKLVVRIANASYDRNAGMLKVMDMERAFGGSLTTELVDYGKKIRYFVENGVCRKTSITNAIPKFGVPDDAKYDTSEYIGSVLPNLGVLVNEYHNIVPDTSIYMSSYAPATGDGSVCVPVLVSNLGARPRLTMSLTYYANVTTDLPHGAFDVPTECM